MSTDELDFNMFDPDMIECPYTAYSELRRTAPVFEVPGLGFYVVSRYEDIARVVRDPATFSSEYSTAFGAQGLSFSTPTEEVDEVMAGGLPEKAALLFTDDPIHRRHRGLVQQAFSARRVAQLEDAIEATAHDIIDEFIDCGCVELMTEYAQRLPLTVISDGLGVPRDDLPTFTVWSDAVTAPVGRLLSDEEQLVNAHHYVAFQHYFAEHIDRRRENPADDLLTDLVRAEFEGEQPLETMELLGIITQILAAGNHTTAKCIGFTMRMLLDNPELMDTVQADPSRLADIVEESLRLEAPVQLMLRLTTRDVEIAGVEVPEGSLLMLAFGSGNRDESVFPEPDAIDIDRPNLRKHLTFSTGAHHCLGAALARVEVRVALAVLLSRAGDFVLEPGTGELEPSPILRGPSELRMTFTARESAKAAS
jgi:cytochrome P450